MSLQSDVKAKRLKSLERVLRQWPKVIKEYIRIGDMPWNYRERAQIGFLAAAAWLSGVVALEEWGSEKGDQGAKRKGRCDLWIDINDYHIEAKHKWSNPTAKSDKEQKRIEDTIAEAKKCAKDLTCSPKSRLAVTFLSPMFPGSKQDNLKDDLDKWLEMVKRLDYDAIAWVLIKPKSSHTPVKPHLPAGIVLLVHKV